MPRVDGYNIYYYNVCARMECVISFLYRNRARVFGKRYIF